MTSEVSVADLQKDLRVAATPEKAKTATWFFKTGEGQYGAGDKFLGLTVPAQRAIAKRYTGLPLRDLEVLLRSEWHEERLTALFIMVAQYKKAEVAQQKMLYELYLCHVGPIGFTIATGLPPKQLKVTKGVAYGVNNWDLVDSSAEFIVGPWLENKTAKERQDILSKLAKGSVWERRVAMLSTFCYIKQGKTTDAYMIADQLKNDTHDLLQKAVGWMLREIGKRCGRDKLVAYLKLHYKTMPRTMLRYAIEHFPPEERQRYLHGEV